MARVALIGTNSIGYIHALIDIWNNGLCAVLIDYQTPFHAAIQMMREAEVNSRFYPYKDTLIAYCDELESTKSFLLDDEHLEEKIERSIFSKVSYPDGFFPL